MPSTQVLEIKIISCGGMIDLMSEQEAAFLVNSLGLFRNTPDHSRAVPRANVSLVRAYTTADFYRAVASADHHLLHLIAHGTTTSLQTGNGKSTVTADEVERRAKRGTLAIPEIVVSTACSFQSKAWRSALKAAGVKVLIAAPQKVTPANLTAFDMSFYSALLSQVRKGKSNIERVEASFTLADTHYRGVHASGTPYARFALAKL